MPAQHLASHAMSERRREAVTDPIGAAHRLAQAEAEVERLRETLHAIASRTDQDIEEPASWWKLVSELHGLARRGITGGGNHE